MNLEHENIGGTNIYRPCLKHELEIRKEAEADFRNTFQEGTHTNSAIINQAIQHRFSF